MVRLLSILCAFIGISGSALAADLPPSPPPRTPAVYVPAVLPSYNWAGIYIGVNGGPLYEPGQSILLHHFPFRDESLTRSKLTKLWNVDESGRSRADASRDTHILARFRSMDAVYSQNWAEVVNFILLDPIASSLEESLPAFGVTLKPWHEMVEPEHQNVLRWYSMVGVWSYDGLKFAYGDDVSYSKGISFLDGHGTIEDWGCGFSHAKTFVKQSTYVGVDGSSPYADRIADLSTYTSDVECIFMRHVLEHNANWRQILKNAISSFKRRMTLIIFTPFGQTTGQIATSSLLTSIPVPDISFKKEDLTVFFEHLNCAMEALETNTQYGIEYVFYLEKTTDRSAPSQL